MRTHVTLSTAVVFKLAFTLESFEEFKKFLTPGLSLD